MIPAALAALLPPGCTADDFEVACARVYEDDPIVNAWQGIQGRELGWANFKVRPDNPAQFDQIESFYNSRDKVSFLVAGNASGKSETCAAKLAEFVLRTQPPPRKDTPFWIISNTYDQVCDVCWAEKLDGHGHIPACEVQWDRISWLNAKKNQPLVVPLKPWASNPNTNWSLEFKSYEQGRRQFQARSIGGFWFSEQFPLDLFIEVLRGCREYMFPGGQFAEFTPVEPELCMWVEEVMDKQPPGWGFYRANTEFNKPNLASGWFEQFVGIVPDEMLATRLTGALATFEGVIFPSFQVAIHVKSLQDEPIFRNPIRAPGLWHYRGLDWGASEEHPFACTWGARDGIGTWWIYDEYWNNSQSAVTRDHAHEIHTRWKWPTTGPYFGSTFADPSRPGEINALAQGFEETKSLPAVPSIDVQPASNSVEKGIDLIRSLLKVQRASNQPRIFICKERCPHLIQELRKYRWLRGKKAVGGSILNPKVAIPKPLKRDDDCVDALRYLLLSATAHEGAVPDSLRYKSFAAKSAGLQLDSTGIGARSQSQAMGERGERQGIFKRTRK